MAFEAEVYRRTAHVYDVIYGALGKDYAAEAADLHALIEHRRPGAVSVLDVACGTGAHLAHLREHYEVAGVDIEAAMLEEARRRLPGVQLVQGDMRTFDLGRRFDAVLCLFSAIGYMPTTRDLDAAVATMVNHLAPGGVLVIDGWVLPEHWEDGRGARTEVAHGEDVEVVRVSRTRREGTAVLWEAHHLIATQDAIEYVAEQHRVTLFERSDYEDAMVCQGLAVDIVDSPMPARDRYIGVAGTK